MAPAAPPGKRRCCLEAGQWQHPPHEYIPVDGHAVASNASHVLSTGMVGEQHAPGRKGKKPNRNKWLLVVTLFSNHCTQPIGVMTCIVEDV